MPGCRTPWPGRWPSRSIRVPWTIRAMSAASCGRSRPPRASPGTPTSCPWWTPGSFPTTALPGHGDVRRREPGRPGGQGANRPGRCGGAGGGGLLGAGRRSCRRHHAPRCQAGQYPPGRLRLPAPVGLRDHLGRARGAGPHGGPGVPHPRFRPARGLHALAARAGGGYVVHGRGPRPAHRARTAPGARRGAPQPARDRAQPGGPPEPARPARPGPAPGPTGGLHGP